MLRWWVCDVLCHAEEEMKELWGFISLGNEGLQLFGDSHGAPVSD
jgi:hypothetical protein